MSKLTKEELSEIQGLVTEHNSLKMKLGETVISQNSIMRSIDNLQAVFQNNEKALIEKYGENASIDVMTGEISYPKMESK